MFSRTFSHTNDLVVQYTLMFIEDSKTIEIMDQKGSRHPKFLFLVSVTLVGDAEAI
jgi:hypothetical protein